MLGKFFGRLYVKICRILLEAKQRVCGSRWCRVLKHLWGTHAVELLIKVFAEKILESLVSKLEIWEWNLGVQGVSTTGFVYQSLMVCFFTKSDVCAALGEVIYSSREQSLIR